MSASVPTLIVSEAQFRSDMPEFATDAPLPGGFPSNLVSRWLLQAQKQLDPTRWTDMYQQGIEWFVAHQLTLAKRDSMPNGQGSSGLPLSKTVGRGSVDYDTTAVTLKDGGPWNLTTYGTQLLYWARLFGSGGLQATGPIGQNENILGIDPLSILNQNSNTW